MAINWKLRLQNKATLLTLATTVIAAVYSILAALGVTPGIAQDDVANLVVTLISVLSAIGIVVDPTTQGLGDSDQALTYTEPK